MRIEHSSRCVILKNSGNIGFFFIFSVLSISVAPAKLRLHKICAQCLFHHPLQLLKPFLIDEIVDTVSLALVMNKSCIFNTGRCWETADWEMPSVSAMAFTYNCCEVQRSLWHSLITFRIIKRVSTERALKFLPSLSIQKPPSRGILVLSKRLIHSICGKVFLPE